MADRLRIALIISVAILQGAVLRAACPEMAFVAPNVYPAGPRPSALASADLDADGNADLIVGNAAPSGGGGVAVLMGNPGGSFRPPIMLVPAATINSVTVADFDGDRFDDVAALDSASHAVLILMNRSGHLSLAGTYPFGFGSGSGLVAGDFDGDGHADLLLVHNFTSLFTLRGRGNGVFEAGKDVPLGSSDFIRPGTAVADVNNDGHADLVLGSEATGTGGAVLFFAGDSKTFLKDPVRFAFTEKPGYPTIADIDGDGALDVIVTFPTSTRLGFVRDVALPGAVSSYSAYGLSPGEFPLLAADFDGDGLPDLLVRGQDQIVLASALGSAQFSFGTPLLVPGSEISQRPLAIDVDHDGRLDVVVASIDGVAVVKNLGGGQFDAPGEVGGFAVGDFNGDGRADLLDWKGPHIEDGLVTRLAMPAGSFTSRSTAEATFGAPVRILDLNGDGKLDVVAFELMRGGSVPSNRVFIGLGRGDGTFNYLGPVTVGHSITSGSVADIDGDGRLDLVVGNGSSQPGSLRAVSIAYGHGDGTFDASVDLDFGSFSASVATGDFNGDGRPDLLLRRDGSDSVVVLNAGAGHFRSPISVGNLPQYFEAADLNGDGKDDFVEVFFGSGAFVRTFLSNGDGTFTQGADVSIFDGSVARVSVRILDIDGDGRPDLAVGVNGSFSYVGSQLVVLLNRASGWIRQKPVRTTAANLDFGDFDGDGTLDLLDFVTPRLARCVTNTDRRRAVTR